jgi:hypothetical protein
MQFTVLYDFTAEEEGEMSVRAGEVVVAVHDAPGAEEPPDGWIHVEVLGDSERGFVPIDYLESVKGFAPAPAPVPVVSKPIEENKTNKPFGGKSIFPSAADVPPAAPKQTAAAKVQPQLTGAAGSTLEKAGAKFAGTAFKSAGAIRATSPPPKAPAQPAANPYSPAPMASNPYTPYNAPSTPLHSPITAALGSSSGHGLGSSSSSNPLAMSKLKSAAKSVQSMVHVASSVTAPRVPSLAAAVDREDFDELVKRNDEYFARLLSSQADTFSSLTDMVDALSKKLNESTQSSGDLVSKLSELDDLIDDEKRKWKQQHESEKNADILGRSKELSQAAYESFG